MRINKRKTVSAVLALVMAASMLTTGCASTEDSSAVAMTYAASEAVTVGSLAKMELAAQNWNETQINEIMYTTQACWSRKIPVAGAETVSKYKKNTKVTVVAATDTGYYKLKDGSFIHSTFLSDEKAGAATTTEDDIEEIFDDDDDTATTKKSSTTTKKSSKTTTAATTKTSSTDKVSSVTYSKDYTTKYVYKQLPAAEKKLYANIVKAATDFKSTAAIPDGLSRNQVIKTYVNVLNQEPQLFWLSNTIPTSSSGNLKLSYIYTKKEAATIQTKLDKNVKTIMNSVNQYKSTFSKIKVIYDWVILNSEFSVSTTDEANSTIKNGLTKGAELQCAGYARTMQYLFDIAGIESVCIIGKNTEGTTHAWNKVYCDNGYYNIDATWGDPANGIGDDYIRYNFFLVPDSWIKNDHLNPATYFRSNGVAISLFDPPAATKTSANYYKVYEKEFSTYKTAMAGFKAELDSAIKAGRVAVTIRVTDSELYEKMNSNTAGVELQRYAKAKSSKVQKLKKFSKVSGGVLVVQYDIVYN